MSKLKKEYVSREIVEDRLLMALDDKNNVAIVIVEEDLELLILGLSSLRIGGKKSDERYRFLASLRALRDSAFRAKK